MRGIASDLGQFQPSKFPTFAARRRCTLQTRCGQRVVRGGYAMRWFLLTDAGMHAASTVRLKHARTDGTGDYRIGLPAPYRQVLGGGARAFGAAADVAPRFPPSPFSMGMPVPPACDGQLSSRALRSPQPPNHPPWRELLLAT